MKLTAKEAENTTKEALKQLKITGATKTSVTTATIVSERIASTAVAEVEVVRAKVTVKGTEKPATDTSATMTIGQSTQSKGDDMTARVKAANEMLSKNIIYTYWTNLGQFGIVKLVLQAPIQTRFILAKRNSEFTIPLMPQTLD